MQGMNCLQLSHSGRALGPGGWKGFLTLLRTVDPNRVLPIALHQAEVLHLFAKERA